MTIPDKIRKCYNQASLMAGIPYVFGGSHEVTDFRDPLVWRQGVDCSSGASIILSAGGILSIPRAEYALDTEEFETWGLPGEGKYLTLWVYDSLDPNGTHHCALQFTGFPHLYWQAANGQVGVGFINFSATDPVPFHPRHWENL